MDLLNRTKRILCKTNVAAGTSDITDATAVDTQGFRGCMFIFAFGAITTNAVTGVRVAGLDTSSPTEGTDDLAGTALSVADSYDDKIVTVDIYRPTTRYLRPVVDRATQNAVLNSIVAILYDPIDIPVTADSSEGASELTVSPIAGTA